MSDRLSIQYTETIRRAVEHREELGLGGLAAASAVATRLAEVGVRTLEEERRSTERRAFYQRLAADASYQAEVDAQAQAALDDRNF